MADLGVGRILQQGDGVRQHRFDCRQALHGSLRAAWEVHDKAASAQSGDSPRVWRLDLERDARLSALLQARDEVIALQRDEAAVLVGCGWWVPRDLEYVLPGVNNFKDCFRLRPEEAVSKRILLVRNEFYNWDKQAILDRYRASCDARIVFRRAPFVISECAGVPR